MARKKQGYDDRVLTALLKAFTKNLAEARAKKGLSQQNLASEATLAISTVSEIENGRFVDVRLSTITALARVLELDPLKLFKTTKS